MSNYSEILVWNVWSSLEKGGPFSGLIWPSWRLTWSITGMLWWRKALKWWMKQQHSQWRQYPHIHPMSSEGQIFSWPWLLAIKYRRYIYQKKFMLLESGACSLEFPSPKHSSWSNPESISGPRYMFYIYTALYNFQGTFTDWLMYSLLQVLPSTVKLEAWPMMDVQLLLSVFYSSKFLSLTVQINLQRDEARQKKIDWSCLMFTGLGAIGEGDKLVVPWLVSVSG